VHFVGLFFVFIIENTRSKKQNWVYFPHTFFFASHFVFSEQITLRQMVSGLIAVSYTHLSLGIEGNPCRPLRGGGRGGSQTRPEEQKRPLAFLRISGTLVPFSPSTFRA